ncbi:phosphatase PAP2 family protein [Staphylococcus sp. SQ8-PEA]|uniref:Phosphatase PAP2 family protein n=1 Tax=Staphylococcus marylandisciuri TaxID=2981529 RepID=A0ABT2QSH4_9STAP|nr:phosphatase PAP2 family protein [Staphylococcus marylandisciuri]MCU5746939.1 phosphatase PAP2 family protein [Staphylococcus marylandisciuri]
MFGKFKSGVTSSALALTGATFIGVSVGLGAGVTALHNLDKRVRDRWYQRYGRPKMNFKGDKLNTYYTIFAKYFDIPAILGIVGIMSSFFYVKKYYVVSAWVLGVVGSGGVVGFVQKNVIQRSRPFQHLVQDTGYSFPSGHAVASSVFFAIVSLVLLPVIKNPIIKGVTLPIVLGSWLSIILSRFYFHAHFLTDVISGSAFGIFWVLLGVKGYKWLLHQDFPIMRIGKTFYMK